MLAGPLSEDELVAISASDRRDLPLSKSMHAAVLEGAGLQAGRRFVGIEQSAEYGTIASARLRQSLAGSIQNLVCG